MTLPSQDFRKTMGHFATGVAVLTSCDSEGKPHGMTINSLTSVSLDPPLLLFCLNTYSKTAQYFANASGFAVNILAENQELIARSFAAHNLNEWDNIAWSHSSLGNPILAGGVAVLECKPQSCHKAGDHHILIAEAQRLDILSAESPLIFFKSHFQSLTQKS